MEVGKYAGGGYSNFAALLKLFFQLVYDGILRCVQESKEIKGTLPKKLALHTVK